MESQKFCLKWNNFQSSVTSVFDSLRNDEELVDITLCCEGKKIKAHRMMLSACSPYFRDLLKENPCQHPVFFLKDTSYEDIRAVVEFVYKGEVNVAQCQLPSFLKTAEMLQVRGLTGDDEEEAAGGKQAGCSGRVPPHRDETPSDPGATPHSFRPLPCQPPSVSPPPQKRSRLSEPAPESCSIGEPVDEPAACVEPLLGSCQPGLSEQPGSAEGTIKVEKVDLVDSDDNSLDASLSASQMAAFEAMHGETGDQTFDPHDQQLTGLLRSSVEPGVSLADTSARTAATSDENSQGVAGTSVGYLRVCELCNKPLYSMSSFTCHMSMHRGYTSCPVCGRVLSSRQRLLHHYRSQHLQQSSGPPIDAKSAPPSSLASSDRDPKASQPDQFDPSTVDTNQ